MTTTKIENKVLIQNAIEAVNNSQNQDDIKVIVDRFIKDLANNCNTESTFNNNRTKFVNTFKNLEISENLQLTYKNHINHCAVTFALEAGKYSELRQLETIETSEETNNHVQEIPTKTNNQKTKAVTLDAQKLIDLSVSLLSSDDYRDIGIGIAFLTGRRQSEVFFYTTFKADDENTMIVQNLSKKRGDNFDNAYRIPVLCNSDLIENAVEKLRKIQPMSELYQIVNNSKNVELGLKTAREKFNDSYNTTILERYNQIARPVFKDFENEIENKTSYFHGLRAASASIWYYLHDSMGYSVEDNIKYVKHALAHDTDGIAQRYTKFKFVNLPSVELFDESVFDINNINEVKIEKSQEKIIELNLTKLIQKLDVVSQQKLSEILQQSDNYETTFATFISKATQAMMVSNAVGNGENVKPDARNKIGNIVMAMINYNASQQTMIDPLYIAINASSVGKMAEYITSKSIDPTTLKNTVSNLSIQIDKCHSELDLFTKLGSRKNPTTNQSELSNLHLRNKDKMNQVLECVKTIYESM